jgi:hypothetical protein
MTPSSDTNHANGSNLHVFTYSDGHNVDEPPPDATNYQEGISHLPTPTHRWTDSERKAVLCYKRWFEPSRNIMEVVLNAAFPNITVPFALHSVEAYFYTMKKAEPSSRSGKIFTMIYDRTDFKIKNPEVNAILKHLEQAARATGHNLRRRRVEDPIHITGASSRRGRPSRYTPLPLPQSQQRTTPPPPANNGQSIHTAIDLISDDDKGVDPIGESFSPSPPSEPSQFFAPQTRSEVESMRKPTNMPPPPPTRRRLTSMVQDSSTPIARASTPITPASSTPMVQVRSTPVAATARTPIPTPTPATSSPMPESPCPTPKRKSPSPGGREPTELDMASSRESESEDPAILFRVFHPNSGGHNSATGFLASSKQQQQLDQVQFHHALLNHMSRLMVPSPFISTTTSLLRALNMLFKLAADNNSSEHGGHDEIRMSIISAAKVRETTTIYWAQPLYQELKSSPLRLLSVKDKLYKASDEWLVWGEISASAMIGTISLAQMELLAASSAALSSVICMPALRERLSMVALAETLHANPVCVNDSNYVGLVELLLRMCVTPESDVAVIEGMIFTVLDCFVIEAKEKDLMKVFKIWVLFHFDEKMQTNNGNNNGNSSSSVQDTTSEDRAVTAAQQAFLQGGRRARTSVEARKAAWLLVSFLEQKNDPMTKKGITLVNRKRQALRRKKKAVSRTRVYVDNGDGGFVVRG